MRWLACFLALCLALFTGCAGSDPSAAPAGTRSPSCDFDMRPGGETFDLVILGGRVMDPECDFDGVRNVGIRDGEIVQITSATIEGEESIDASGHVVAPGFIDTHTHSSDKFAIKMSMMDGVTTGLDLELGALNIADVVRAGSRPVAHELRSSVCRRRWPAWWCTTDCTFRRSRPMRPRRVSAAGASRLEDGVEGWSATVSNLDQMNQHHGRILDENLRQGAIGVGSTIGYATRGISDVRDVRGAARSRRATGG